MLPPLGGGGLPLPSHFTIHSATPLPTSAPSLPPFTLLPVRRAGACRVGGACGPGESYVPLAFPNISSTRASDFGYRSCRPPSRTRAPPYRPPPAPPLAPPSTHPGHPRRSTAPPAPFHNIPQSPGMPPATSPPDALCAASGVRRAHGIRSRLRARAHVRMRSPPHGAQDARRDRRTWA